MSLHEDLKGLDYSIHKQHIQQFGWTRVYSPENPDLSVIIRKSKEHEKPMPFVLISDFTKAQSYKDLLQCSCLLFLAGHVLATLEGVDPHSGAPLSDTDALPATAYIISSGRRGRGDLSAPGCTSPLSQCMQPPLHPKPKSPYKLICANPLCKKKRYHRDEYRHLGNEYCDPCIERSTRAERRVANRASGGF